MSSRKSKKQTSFGFPEYLVDTKNNLKYEKCDFIGKGTFAQCFLIKNKQSHEQFAVKIISKRLQTIHNIKESVKEEIALHRSLDHKNIVKLISDFTDTTKTCIVLEFCSNHSMSELRKRRGVITDYECSFYIYQILEGVNFLHDKNIIHRDIKLGNLFLNDRLNVKIGDFGLATRIEFDGERKKTFCGTPKYMAPEILSNIGYSFEVDVWAIGCAMFTLLVGRGPFEANTSDETFDNIKHGYYKLPIQISTSAAEMIVAMLQSKPENRPSADKLLLCDFIRNENIPDFLPSSCLSMAPRQAEVEGGCIRKPLLEVNGNTDNTPK